MTTKRAAEGWQPGMGMWEGWTGCQEGAPAPGVLHGAHGTFLTPTLAGMLWAPWDDNITEDRQEKHPLGAAVAGAWTKSEINGFDTGKCWIARFNHFQLQGGSSGFLAQKNKSKPERQGLAQGARKKILSRYSRL